MEQENTAVVEWVDIVDEKMKLLHKQHVNKCEQKTYVTEQLILSCTMAWEKFWHNAVLKQKDFYPGWLDATAGGVVQQGENALESARREAEEELRYCRSSFCRTWTILL